MGFIFVRYPGIQKSCRAGKNLAEEFQEVRMQLKFKFGAIGVVICLVVIVFAASEPAYAENHKSLAPYFFVEHGCRLPGALGRGNAASVVLWADTG